MEYIIHFLENNIVVNWIAPIATTLVATALIRIFTIGKKQKKINYANKKYVDAISPYMIQKLKLKIEILYSIRNAISIETGVSKKDLYSTMFRQHNLSRKLRKLKSHNISLVFFQK